MQDKLLDIADGSFKGEHRIKKGFQMPNLEQKERMLATMRTLGGEMFTMESSTGSGQR